MPKTSTLAPDQQTLPIENLPEPARVDSGLTREEWEALVEPQFLLYAYERGLAERIEDRAFTYHEAVRFGRFVDAPHPNWPGLFVGRLHRVGLLVAAGSRPSLKTATGGSLVYVWMASPKLMASPTVIAWFKAKQVAA